MTICFLKPSFSPISKYKSLRNVEKSSILKSTNVFTKMIFGPPLCDGVNDYPEKKQTVDLLRKTAALEK